MGCAQVQTYKVLVLYEQKRHSHHIIVKGALLRNDIVATSGPETAKLFSAEGITVKSL